MLLLGFVECFDAQQTEHMTPQDGMYPVHGTHFLHGMPRGMPPRSLRNCDSVVLKGAIAGGYEAA